MKLVAVPTLHPAFLARSQELIPAVVADLKKLPTPPPENYDTKPDIDIVRNFVFTEFAADIECVRETGEITMVGLCAESTKAICVPCKGLFKEELKRIFSNAKTLIGHNLLQFDEPRLERIGIAVPKDCFRFDTMLAQHLLQPDLPHDLGFLGSFFTAKPAWKHFSYLDEPLYCCRDVDVTWQCYRQLRPMLEHEGLLDLYSNVQVPLARICLLLHETGFRLDPSRLKEVRKDLLSKEQELEGQLPEGLRTRQVPIRKRQPAPPGTLSPKTGKPLKFVMVETTDQETPWKSNEVLQDYFYNIRQLPQQLHAKTQRPTVDKTALPKLLRAAGKPAYAQSQTAEVALEVTKALRALQELRVIASLLSTFAKEDFGTFDRIHASFNVHGTASGRLSSSDPNLQNIPVSTRYIYVPSHKDWVIVNADFSSLENRLTAHFAGDYERLERMSQPGFSEHKWNTSRLFDIPYEDVVKDPAGDSPYTKAKKVTHGLNYGEGALKIARINDLPFPEVKALCEKWKQENAKTVAWQQATAAQAAKDGYLTTPFGRKRFFYTDSKYTESLSFLPQSTGADLMFRCMIALMYERIGWPEDRVANIVQIYQPLPHPARMLVTVHDSIVLEAPIDLEHEIQDVLQRVMSQSWPELGGYSIPIEIGVGPSWGECH